MKPRRRSLPLAPALLAAILLTGACADDATEAQAPLADAEFIEIMVELRQAEWEAESSDSAADVFDRRKAEILDRHQTTEEEIREFVRITSGDLPRLNAIWDSISRQLRHERTMTEPQ